MELKVTSFSKEKFLEENINALVEKKDKVNHPDFAFLLSKGFGLKEMIWYNLDRENYTNYLPESIRFKITLNTNNGYWPVLHDKLIFYSFIKDSLPTPRLLGTIFLGVLTPEDNFFTLDTIYQDETAYVLKPLQGGRGQGILFIKNVEGHIFVNDEKISVEKLNNIIQGLDKYGIFEYVYQHKSLSEIYSESINTIRIVTLQDPQNNKPYIFAAILRIGWSGSKPFDNFAQGGLAALIDIETGIVSKWKCKKGDVISEGAIHPDSGIKISGFQLPYWDQIKSTILNYLDKHLFFNCVGWDVIVSQDGFYILEGNHNPDIDIVQVFKGYLTEEKNINLFKTLDIYE